MAQWLGFRASTTGGIGLISSLDSSACQGMAKKLKKEK